VTQADGKTERRPVAERDAAADRNGAGVSNRAVSNTVAGAVPLPAALRAEMESRFGVSFASVRIRNDADAHREADQLEANAYTVGENITFAEAKFMPHTEQGKHLLAHELAHVVQQRRGGAQPALDSQAPHEVAAHQAADAVASGSGPVSVSGGTAVGVARDKADDKKKKNRDRREDDSKVPPPAPLIKPKAASPGMETIRLEQGIGLLGEVTSPFDLYTDPSWNVMAGGDKTSSSRTSIARKTPWGDTAGIDHLVENRKTGRLVIGEQKATSGPTFEKATATTVNLEKNLEVAQAKLKASIKSGRVHPAEVANVQNTIDRLAAANKAIKSRSSIPEGIVFELTSTGGKGTKIGKGYIDQLAKKYGDNPEFMAKLLKRTFIRDPKLARAMGRDPKGKVGTNTDPDIVPAEEVMTKEAKSEMQRRLARKTPKEWKEKLEKEKLEQKAKDDAKQAEEKRVREEQRKADKAKRDAAKEKLKADAEKAAQEARNKKLEELREAAKRKGDPEPTTKKAKQQAESKLNKEAKAAGNEARKRVLDAAAQSKAKAKAEAKVETKVEAKPAAPEPVAPKEPVVPKTPPTKTAGPIEAPHGPVEVITPKSITPKTAVKTTLGVAGGLAAISGAKDIINDVKEGHYGTAAAKTGALGLGFYAPAAPLMIAGGAIMNYWGPRHDSIQADSFAVGDAVAEATKHVPLIGRSETARRVVGGIAASGTAVAESLYYTGKDFVGAVGDGAETLGGLAVDAYDYLTDGPSLMDIVNEQIKRSAEDD
jgi:hypothetical protein